MQATQEGDSLLQILSQMSDAELAEAKKLIRVLANRRETLRAMSETVGAETRRGNRKKKTAA
jgi:hypothetical protein